MSVIIFFIQQVILFTVPLIVAGIGGMFCERSGIINISIEGNMIVGAFCGCLFLHFAPESLHGQFAFFCAMAIAAMAGLVYASFHALASINLKANQVISGIALNIAAPALSIFLARLIIGKQQIGFTNSFRIEAVPILSKIPFLGDIFFRNVYISLYITIGIIIIGGFIVRKTRFGMRLRACGEYPQAADTVGINVYKIRWIGVLTCGFLAGLAGVMLVVSTATEFNAGVSGYGFLAVSVLILGQWNTRGIVLASIFFGVMKTLSAVYSALPILDTLSIDAFYYRMLPFVVTLVVLAVSSKHAFGPAAAGEPYDKGRR